MFVVITKVALKPGTVDSVRELFEKTNPGLVEGQTDWLEAKFTVERKSNQVTVLAFWRNAESYQKFSTDKEFRSVMSQFAQYFAGPPDVTINEILFEM